MIQKMDGGITAPKGFVAGGVFAGLKKNKKDMAMIYSETPCQAAGVFTRNIVKAAPVKFDKEVIDSGKQVHAVVINSGVANACTGEQGMAYCRQMAQATEKALGLGEGTTLVCSTGVIGAQLPMDIICHGIDLLQADLGADRDHATLAAESIMTTDTVSKEVCVEFCVGGKKATMAGICKGAGMIHPNMCTMLCFITTDACISKELLQKALSADVEDTFNMVSVDGDTSTNDTVLVLANGLAGNEEITTENEDYAEFCQALNVVMTGLSKKIAGDGEGASALFEVKVVNAASKEQAKVLAKSIVTSSLTKAAIFGHDANWGRILCAMGYSGADFDPEKTDIYFESEKGKLQIVENGTATGYSEEVATEILSAPEVTAIADIKAGNASATAWGCDLTYDYVKINADYRS